MAYKKPKIIAKSEPKQTYVAGCPWNCGEGDLTPVGCGYGGRHCMVVIQN